METRELYGNKVIIPSLRKKDYFQIMKKTVDLMRRNDLLEVLPKIFSGKQLEEIKKKAEELNSEFSCSAGTWLKFVEGLSDQESQILVTYLLTREQ